jgi:DNA-directed RNA polymerase subunit M/transcription elongation factor TFIIS
MPKHFCDNCHNLLETNTANDQLTFQCRTCLAVYKSEPDDSLRYEETNSGNIIIFQTILNKAKDDPVNSKTYIDCPKCKNNMAKPVRLGEELRLIYVCEDCGFQWIDVK